jgi:hypothetical protein
METYKSSEQKLEEDQRKFNSKEILFYIMLFLVIALSLYLIYFVKTESYKCMNTPLSYGVSKLSSSSGNEVVCSCSSEGNDNILIVTKDNISYFSP